MKRITQVLVATLSLSAVAQPVRNELERRNDRKDLRQDRRQIANDTKDLADVNALLGQFDAAVAKSDAAGIKAADDGFTRYLAREAIEANVEVHQAQQEVREDRREVRGDRREVTKDVVVGKRPGAVADDVRDLNRDRANLANDVGDAAKERAARNRLAAIRAELVPLKGLVDPAATAKKRVLYAEVANLARTDLARTKVEQVEDRRELREDRRERREDRRSP